MEGGVISWTKQHFDGYDNGDHGCDGGGDDVGVDDAGNDDAGNDDDDGMMGFD